MHHVPTYLSTCYDGYEVIEVRLVRKSLAKPKVTTLICKERQRALTEERCAELSAKAAATDRELQQLRPLQASHSNLQRQYQELNERIRTATELARK